MIQPLFENLLTLLQNQALGNVAGVVSGAISGIIVPVVLHIREQRHSGKVIAHELVKVVPQQTRPPYSTVHKVTWRIWNRGDETIEEWDYRSQPVEFSFGSAATVLSSKITEVKPDDFVIKKAPPSINSNVSRFDPICLNKGNSITFEFEVADITLKELRLNLRITENDTIDMKAKREKLVRRAQKFRNGTLLLVVLWIITVVTRSFFPSLLDVYPVSIGLTFLIALLAALCIVNYVYAITSK
jgi:uncharacterized membrane protein (DUF485 family)